MFILHFLSHLLEIVETISSHISAEVYNNVCIWLTGRHNLNDAPAT